MTFNKLFTVYYKRINKILRMKSIIKISKICLIDKNVSKALTFNKTFHSTNKHLEFDNFIIDCLYKNMAS